MTLLILKIKINLNINLSVYTDHRWFVMSCIDIKNFFLNFLKKNEGMDEEKRTFVNNYLGLL